MCAIIASFDLEILCNLFLDNQNRGQYGFSITSIDPKSLQIVHYQTYNTCRVDYVNQSNISTGLYHIIHIMTPTSSEKCFHPAEKNKIVLWHNGMLKSHCIESMQIRFMTDESWDSMLILEHWIRDKHLNDLDGTFACLLIEQESNCFYMFRNRLSPLYIDSSLNISSSQLKGGRLIDPDQIWEINLLNKTIINRNMYFQTVDCPYYIFDKN